MGSVGGAQVHHLLEALRGLGLDAEGLCRGAGMDPATLLAPGTRIPWANTMTLVTAAEAASGDPLIGLHAAEAIGARGVLAFLIRAQPTVEQALRQLSRYASIATDELAVQVERRPNHAVLRAKIGSGLFDGERLVREYTAALFVIELRESSRRRFRASEVRLPD